MAGRCWPSQLIGRTALRLMRVLPPQPIVIELARQRGWSLEAGIDAAAWLQENRDEHAIGHDHSHMRQQDDAARQALPNVTTAVTVRPSPQPT